MAVITSSETPMRTKFVDYRCLFFWYSNRCDDGDNMEDDYDEPPVELSNGMACSGKSKIMSRHLGKTNFQHFDASSSCLRAGAKKARAPQKASAIKTARVIRSRG